MSEPDSPKTPDVECPECHAHFGVTMTAKYLNPTRTAITMTKKSGQLFAAEDVSTLIGSYGRLLKSIAKEMGGHVMVAVESIALEGEELRVTFMVLEIQKKGAKQ